MTNNRFRISRELAGYIMKANSASLGERVNKMVLHRLSWEQFAVGLSPEETFGSRVMGLVSNLVTREQDRGNDQLRISDNGIFIGEFRSELDYYLSVEKGKRCYNQIFPKLHQEFAGYIGGDFVGFCDDGRWQRRNGSLVVKPENSIYVVNYPDEPHVPKSAFGPRSEN
jgi:hypothetical protein